MNFKRDLVKYVRDKAKSQYNKSSNCFICDSTEQLDFHHYHGLTELLDAVEPALSEHAMFPSTTE